MLHVKIVYIIGTNSAMIVACIHYTWQHHYDKLCRLGPEQRYFTGAIGFTVPCCDQATLLLQTGHFKGWKQVFYGCNQLYGTPLRWGHPLLLQMDHRQGWGPQLPVMWTREALPLMKPPRWSLDPLSQECGCRAQRKWWPWPQQGGCEGGKLGHFFTVWWWLCIMQAGSGWE